MSSCFHFPSSVFLGPRPNSNNCVEVYWELELTTCCVSFLSPKIKLYLINFLYNIVIKWLTVQDFLHMHCFPIWRKKKYFTGSDLTGFWLRVLARGSWKRVSNNVRVCRLTDDVLSNQSVTRSELARFWICDLIDWSLLPRMIVTHAFIISIHWLFTWTRGSDGLLVF